MVVLLKPFNDRYLSDEALELIFWQQNIFRLCIKKEIPDKIPPIQIINELLSRFKTDNDYYALVNRMNFLKKIVQQ